MQPVPQILLISIILTISVKNVRSIVCMNQSKRLTCESISEFTKTTISEIEGIGEATTLDIRNSESNIQPDAFQSGVKLERLIIMNNKITNVPSDTFRNLPVKLLYLSHNGIKSIYPGAFSNLPQLKTLRVDNNNLKQLMLGVFTNLPIEELVLSKNNLEALDNGVFDNLPNLKKLKLDGNKLEIIFLHRIITFPERLDLLWLNNNSLTTVSNYMLQKLSKLRVLNLAFNPITFIEANSFEQTLKLNYLVISHTHLKEIDGNIFLSTGMDNLEKLYLDNNKLMYLTSKFFVRLGNLKKITLIGNPWLCSCLTVIQRILAENNVQEMCGEEYTSGNRPICVGGSSDDLECRYVYNASLSEKFQKYQKDHPLYAAPLSCIL